MEYKEFEGKTLDEAIASAIREIGVQFEELDIQVISEGSKGLFGIMGNKDAKILAAKNLNGRTEKSDTKKKLHEQRPTSEETAHTVRDKNTNQAVLEKAKEELKEVLRLMNIESEISIREDNTLEITGDGSGLIIGKRGQTLDALQLILRRIINKGSKAPVRINLDSEGYRKRHIEYLKDIAIKMGREARHTGRSVSLEKMNPHDRRIIHITLKNDERISTKSVGDGVYKKVMIFPKKASKY